MFGNGLKTEKKCRATWKRYQQYFLFSKKISAALFHKDAKNPNYILNKSENVYIHINSSSKIALILFIRNKMKANMKISLFDFQLLETHVQHKWYTDVRCFIEQKRN